MTCLFCSIDKLDSFSKQTDRSGQDRHIYSCKNCGVLITSNRTVKEKIVNHLQGDVYKQKKYDRNDFIKDVNKDYFVLQELKTHFTLMTGNALDVGAHIGGFCYNLRGLGFETYGLDIYNDAVKFGVKNGERIYLGDFPNDIPEELLNKKYTIISFMESFYYLVDPKRSLLKVMELLDKGGYLLIQSINGLSNYYSNKNESYFIRYGDYVQFIPNMKTFEYWLKEVGLDIVWATSLPSFKINQIIKYSGPYNKLIKKIGLGINKIFSRNVSVDIADKIIILAQKK